jgi:threonine/homoserine/homoserine lactone efflux protein
MNTDIFLAYVATWLLVSLTPGPAVMCAMSQATRYGVRHALLGIAGLLLAHVVFFACIASGLAALLARATAAFTVLRIIGAVYLLYLGVRLIVSTLHRHRAEAEKIAVPPSRHSLLLQGFAIQITNPKALLFMSALLPQFIQPQQPLAWQIVILFAVTVTVDAVVLSAYAGFARSGACWFRSSRITILLERAFGALLLGFGIRLLAASKSQVAR